MCVCVCVCVSVQCVWCACVCGVCVVFVRVYVHVNVCSGEKETCCPSIKLKTWSPWWHTSYCWITEHTLLACSFWLHEPCHPLFKSIAHGTAAQGWVWRGTNLQHMATTCNFILMQTDRHVRTHTRTHVHTHTHTHRCMLHTRHMHAAYTQPRIVHIWTALHPVLTTTACRTCAGLLWYVSETCPQLRNRHICMKTQKHMQTHTIWYVYSSTAL